MSEIMMNHHGGALLQDDLTKDVKFLVISLNCDAKSSPDSCKKSVRRSAPQEDPGATL